MNSPATYTKILRALSEGEIQYLLIGGIAVTLHGYPRMTFDIDFLLLMTTENLQSTYKILTDLNYKPLLPIALEQICDT